jgi:antitoxin component YwqK of YwqJK toxin-antitoxin module
LFLQRSLGVAALLLLHHTSVAQRFEIKDTIFLDKDWLETENRAEAMYYRGISYQAADSTWLVDDFYLETFTIQMIGQYRGAVKPGNQEGVFRYYYKNGNPRAVYFFRNGKIEGTTRRYYENGSLQQTENYRNGELSDTVRYFYPNGNPHEIKVLNPGFNSENLSENEKQYLLISAWDATGNQQVINGNGTKIDYYPNGKKRTAIEYVNGFPHGEWIQYGAKRKVKSKMTFKNGTFISGIIYNNRKKDIVASLFREPRFAGGAKGLDEFIQRNTGRCKEGFKEEVMLLITVTETGEPIFEQVLSGDVSHCQFEELQALVQRMPKWTPAVRYANYVETTYVIRVRY